MAKKSSLELTWYGKEENREIETRVLIEDMTKSNTSMDPDTGNILVHGDNLLALKALESKFAGTIKCIYIDPPFNTGAAFENYDDNLEHSIWINLMYLRLRELRKLLTDDGGVILVELDDSEMHYLKVVLDEIFGRNNFIANIIVKSNSISGTKEANKNKTILRSKDNILVYKKTERLTVNPQFVEKTKWDTHYNSHYITFESGEYHDCSLKDYLVQQDIISSSFKIDEDALENEAFCDFCLKNADNIYQIVNSISEEGRALSLQKPNRIIEYSRDGDDKKHLALNGKRLTPLSSTIQIINGEKKFAQLLGDLWTDIDFQNTQNEGNCSFPDGKKPEALLKRIIEMFTKEGDYVLDSFLGSGTTCAVAHKLNRKWIGIEMGNQAYTHCIPRLNSIIDGTDKSGISRYISFSGGGGYRFYELAPTLIKEDSHGQPIINPEYNADMLAASIALHEGYTYEPSSECFWKQSIGQENSYLFVTTLHVNQELINSISSQMNNDEKLLVVCRSYDQSIDFGNSITIKKIPQSLLNKCEFNHDDYSLNIINPPIYEEEE